MSGCVLCDEAITLADEPALTIGTLDASGLPKLGYVHRQCQLREGMGGIGHLIAHEYWCLQQHDPDAGLTYRQSALLVDAWITVVGIPIE